MMSGLPYDSDAAYGLCGSITALLHGSANRTSAELSGVLGPFERFAENREPMLRVMQMHRDAVEDINEASPKYLKAAAADCGKRCSPPAGNMVSAMRRPLSWLPPAPSAS